MVPLTLLDVAFEAEELLAEDSQPIDHVEIGVGHAEAQAPRVQ